MSKPKPLAPGLQTVEARSIDERLADIAHQLHWIGTLIEKAITRPPPGPLPEPSEFVSGGFHRRSGDIYQSVAEPGTPNAGVTDGDDPSGTV